MIEKIVQTRSSRERDGAHRQGAVLIAARNALELLHRAAFGIVVVRTGLPPAVVICPAGRSGYVDSDQAIGVSRPK
ncbi:MAG: hypothetical protein R3C69_06195 [Geminicoccaceae bacterium]